jgi:predicted nucleic acid-binding protein
VFTIDASVWVNADSPAEPGQAVSRALLDTLFANATTIVVPTLLAVEVAAAIARGRGDPMLASDMALALFALPTVRWIALDDALARQSVALAAQHRLRGADAVYAAVAMMHACELVSLDHEHLTRLPQVLRTLTPAEALVALNAP